MPRSKRDVTEAEQAVLEVLWQQETATVRQVAEALYSNYSSSEHATAQKLMDRLRAKGFVDRDRSVWPHVFRAKLKREDLIGRRLETMAESLCGGSFQPLITHLVRHKKLSKKDRASLRSLLDELDRRRGAE